ncbi:unnamed protein product [Prunus armeniaca]
MESCPSLEFLQLQHLTSLQRLYISWGDNLQFMPKEGLQPSLSLLQIYKCSGLEKRYENKMGKDWANISQIPCIQRNDPSFFFVLKTQNTTLSTLLAQLPTGAHRHHSLSLTSPVSSVSLSTLKSNSGQHTMESFTFARFLYVAFPEQGSPLYMAFCFSAKTIVTARRNRKAHLEYLNLTHFCKQASNKPTFDIGDMAENSHSYFRPNWHAASSSLYCYQLEAFVDMLGSCSSECLTN